MTVFGFFFFCFLGPQDAQVTIQAGRQPVAPGEQWFADAPLAKLELRTVDLGKAIVKQDARRQVVQVGDQLGSQRARIIAIQHQRLVLKTATGFVILEPDGQGGSRLQNLDPGNIPASIRRQLEAYRTRTQAQ